ncbi:MAG: hypothetical protein FWG13_03245 [Leptospirales bacterium]|nr:hypothetical protein [Leptospirales bacterium]
MEIKDDKWENIFTALRALNPNITENRKNFKKTSFNSRGRRLQKVLVANRGEIAKRFFFALHEEGIPSVAVITDPDIGQSWYDFAGEVIHIGDSLNYSNMDVIISAAVLSGANAIYPGYGFLSENPYFVRRINEASRIFGREIIFMGPGADVIDRVGDKIRARILAEAANISLLDGDDHVESFEQAAESARRIGYPVMLKLSAGGGGRGIIPCRDDDELKEAIENAQRIGWTLYKDTRFFIEKLVERPIHIEVQLFNGHAIGIRKCAVQRRRQKIIEESAQFLVDDSTALSMLAQAQIIAKISGYADGCGAGTVEYLLDRETGSFGFLEINTRLQVEYAVTEQSLGIDIVKWQIALFDGRADEIPIERALINRLRPPMHAIECRVYAEDAADDYRPSPGLIKEITLPTFNGIRCDFGFAAEDRIASMYDAMIGKIIAYGSTRDECIIRLERALQEIYVKGLHTNVKQLIEIVRHPEFIKGEYTNNILDDFPELSLAQAKDGARHKTDRRGRSTIALGALTEYIYAVRKSSAAFIQSIPFTGLSGRRGIAVPYKFNAVYNGAKYEVAVYPVSLEKYYIFIDGQYNGKVYLTSSNINRGEYIFRYGNGSYRLRVDRRTKYLSIKIKDRSNKVNYYRLSVFPKGIGVESDPQGMVRSPFQCTFVALADDPSEPSKKIRPGVFVKKGDFLMIISSMKMDTKIFAPLDGSIQYLIEDGNMGRLALGAAPDGRVLGKSIEEGEVLLIVKPADAGADAESPLSGETPQTDAVKSEKNYYPLAREGIVYKEDIERFFMKNPKKMMPLILEIFHAAIAGFIDEQEFLSDILTVFEKVDEDKWREVLTPDTEEKLCSLITFYYNVLQLFSPVVRDGFSFQEKFNHYIHNIDNYEYKPDSSFKDLILSVLDNYDIKELKPSLEGDTNMNAVAFFNLQNAYFICYENKNVIKKLIKILSYSENSLLVTARMFGAIVDYEQSEPDDSLAKFVRKILSNNFSDANETPSSRIDHFKGISAAEFVKLVFPASGNPHPEEIMLKSWEALDMEIVSPHGNDIMDTPSEIADRINILERSSVLTRIYSPYNNIFMYSSRNSESEHYIAFVIAKNIADDNVSGIPYSVIKIPPVSDAIEKAYKMLTVYNLIKKRPNNRLEVIAPDTVLKSDPLSNGIGALNFVGLMGLSYFVVKFSELSGADSIFFYFDFSARDSAGLSKVYKLQKKDAGFTLDLLSERDPRNHYHAAIDSREMHLYSMKKWPVDIWASQTFDNGEYEEVSIDTVDFNLPEEGAKPPVGAKIFVGHLNAITVCFYMKDSRINGGATGDLEGLKYAAAVYLSYLKGWPLYVWNDGAGANINQGVISVSRACEGFMMNVVSGMDLDSFKKYTAGSPDRRLNKLFSTIERQFFRDGLPAPGKTKFHFITAVGIGSSAGLDVYGSSQAPVQIILDSEQSYRALTGSGVIRSVTGENIPNYEIGGAKVMGRWAGIVDIVANGKYRLISNIRSINDMFSFEDDTGLIQKPAAKPAGYDSGSFSENDVISNVDDGNFLSFKQDYYGGGSVIAGFAKLGGRRAVIIGPKSSDGIRSFPSVVRAHDVLRSASRMNIPAILLFSGKWHQNAELYDVSGVRARMDFVNVLTSHPKLKICVATDVACFHCLEIVSACDVIIFVRNSKTDEVELEFVERNAAFIVGSLAEAFELSHRLINLVHPLSNAAGEPAGLPDIPEDPKEPYDMLDAVIKKITDGGEFLEFFESMNRVQTRPHFITGLAKINGETTAILADQPLILGGAADAPNTEKYRVFVQFASRLNLRILMLSNSSGFIPGTKQERIRIQAIGAESIDNNILSRVPVVSIVVNQNYGGRQAQAFGRFLRPGIYAMARGNSQMAVIGGAAAFDLLKAKHYNELLEAGKGEEAEAMKKKFIEEHVERFLAKNGAFSAGALDEIIDDITKLRELIAAGFEKAAERCRNAFGAQ